MKRTLTDDSDEVIVRLIVEEGQRNLFECLYDRYAPLIYRKCLGLTNDTSIAQDLLQDIILKVFLNLSKFEHKSNFSLWVNTISYNHCMQYFRLKKRLIVQAEDLSPYEALVVDDIEMEHEELQQIQQKQLTYLLQQLKEEERLILSMRYFSDMSIQEIAHSLELNQSTVKMRLKRSRDKLAKLFKTL